MNLVQRVQDILLKPRETWPVIAAEPADTAGLYKHYLLILAAIAPIASFIGMSLVGVGAFGVHIRVPILSGLVSAIVSYAISLAMVFVLALIVDALAPSFGGVKNQIQALKVVAYSMTAGFVAGVLNLLPSLSILGVLAGLYGIYLLYTGLPVLMQCPPEKAIGYTAVVTICGIVAGILVGSIAALATPSPMARMGAASGDGAISIKTPEGSISIDTAKMEAMARKMEEAGKKMEQAQASGDPAAAGKAAADILGAMAGGGGTPIPASDLKALLPDTLAGLPRESYEAQGGGAMGIAASSAKAVYRQGDQRVELSITDMGGLGGLLSVAGWANLTVDKDSSDAVEKIYKQGPRTVREQYRKDGSHGEYMLILGNGMLVEAKGQNTPFGDIKSAVGTVDLGKLEALQRPAKS